MIGRTDIVIPRPADEAGKTAILRILRAAWPEAIVEDAESDDEPMPLSVVPIGALTAECFIYRDARALHGWEQDAGTAENLDTMVHLLLGPTSVTCVVDPREGSETRAIAARIERALEGAVVPPLVGPFFEGLDDPAHWIEGAP